MRLPLVWAVFGTSRARKMNTSETLSARFPVKDAQSLDCSTCIITLERDLREEYTASLLPEIARQKGEIDSLQAELQDAKDNLAQHEREERRRMSLLLSELSPSLPETRNLKGLTADGLFHLVLGGTISLVKKISKERKKADCNDSQAFAFAKKEQGYEYHA